MRDPGRSRALHDMSQLWLDAGAASSTAIEAGIQYLLTRCSCTLHSTRAVGSGAQMHTNMTLVVRLCPAVVDGPQVSNGQVKEVLVYAAATACFGAQDWGCFANTAERGARLALGERLHGALLVDDDERVHMREADR